MVLLLYSEQKSKREGYLYQKIGEVVPPAQLKRFQRFTDLFQYLLQSVNSTNIIVLQASSQEKFNEFKLLNDSLRNIKLLLVLPDHQEQTLFLAHQLHPRYVAFENGNYDDLASVLEHMLKKNKQLQ